MLAVSLVAGTFILLRKIEHWLHQHIFKVGWLLTHDYRTTTILYYAFFFPGIVLHELTYWLMAGALNVAAERSIQWPEPQEVGELKLNFVRISPRTTLYKKAIITATPLIVALGIIWWGAHNVFDLGGAVRMMSTGDVYDVADGLGHLTNAPDFWLWVYLIFTISNTMYPAIPKDLQGWRTIVGAIGIISILAFVIGIGQDVFQLVGEPIGEFLIVLEGILIFIICINVFMTMVLGAVESVIERVTGHSATFKRGKMITMTREEAIAQRQKDRERQRKQQQALAATNSRRAVGGNISSVYALMLPVPGGPEELILAAPTFQIEPEETLALPDRPAISPRLGAEVVTVGEAPSTSPALPAGPKQPTKTIPAVAEEKKSTSNQKAVIEDQVDEAVRMMRINTPTSRNAPPPDAPVAPSHVDDAVETFRASAPTSAPEKPAESEAKPPASVPSVSTTPPKPSTPFGKPASPFGAPKPPPPADEDDEDSALFRPFDAPASAKPTTPVSLPFSKPASPFGAPKPPLSADEDEDEDEEDRALFRPFDPPAAAKPSAPVSSPFNRPASPFGVPKSAPSQPDDEDEDDDLSAFRQPDRPAAAKPSTPVSSPFGKPASPFGAPKPAPSQPDDEDEDDLDSFRQPDRPAATKPTTPVSSPFNRPASPFGAPKPIQADDKANEAAKPKPAKPNDPEKGVPFERPTSPFSFPAPADDDDEDEDLSAFRKADRTVVNRTNTPFKPASPFDAPKPPTPQETRPAASKPTDPEKGVPFTRPASPFGPSSKPDEKADPNAPRTPNRPAFGTQTSPAVKPASPFGPKSNEGNPNTPPAASGPRPAAFPPPRFGAKPNTPAGTPPKPGSPFGRKTGDDEDESISNRLGTTARDTTDDLFEDFKRPNAPALPPKRTTTTQPIVRPGGFGTSRPVPKKSPQPQKRSDDEDLDEVEDTIRYEDEDLRYSDDDDVTLPDDD